jgi:hypothetical protein
VADDVIESTVRQWLRDHEGQAHCAACVARDLNLEVDIVRAAMEALAPRQIFSSGPCVCGATGLCYGSSGGSG